MWETYGSLDVVRFQLPSSLIIDHTGWGWWEMESSKIRKHKELPNSLEKHQTIGWGRGKNLLHLWQLIPSKVKAVAFSWSVDISLPICDLSYSSQTCRNLKQLRHSCLNEVLELSWIKYFSSDLWRTSFSFLTFIIWISSRMYDMF